MTKRKLKPFVVPMIYTTVISLFVFSMYYLQKVISTSVFSTPDVVEDDSLKYVDDQITDNHNYLPVVGTTTMIVRPYTDGSVTVARGYYDYKASDEEQRNSIVYYEDTYMQNSGIDYVGADTFDVISILDGKVIDVYEDNILGTVVKIQHADNIVSVYQSLSDVVVNKDDTVLQGQVIAKSGKSNLNASLGNHLHFELYVQDVIVNPLDYYDKSVDDIIGG